MAESIFPPFPPELNDEEFAHLVSETIDWCQAHGLSVRPPPALLEAARNPTNALSSHAPVTLFPSPFPRKNFQDALKIQKVYNELYAKIVQEESWLVNIIEDLSKHDTFISNLYSIHTRISSTGGPSQPLSLGLFRSDYMLHISPSSPPAIHQVEFNTIASSFGGLSSLTSTLHTHLYTTGHYTFSPTSPISISSLPPNPATADLARGLAFAHNAYGPATSSFPKETAILFLVQPNERNIFDQRALEYALTDTHTIVVHRATPADLMAAYANTQRIQATSDPSELKRLYELPRLELEKPTNALIYKPPYARRAYEISTVYFRSMYDPSDYESSDAADLWELRYLIERSNAIKCPSILTHLAGSKKVQQALCAPGELERFLSQRDAEKVRSTFAMIYPLDDSELGRKAQELALNPETAQHYVLKPQREGGGNNVYRGKIPGFLQSIGKDKWPGYILMELIEPPSISNVVLRNGNVEKGGVVNELGVYGVTLWSREKIQENYQAGYLLRTKGVESEEGGVAAGYGCVDSVCLIGGEAKEVEEDLFASSRTELEGILEGLELGEEAESVKAAFLKRFKDLQASVEGLPSAEGDVGRAISLGLGEGYGRPFDFGGEEWKMPEGEEWGEFERMGGELEGFEKLGRELERRLDEVDRRLEAEFRGVGVPVEGRRWEGGSVFDPKGKEGEEEERKE
ncbi:glutathione synthetase [Ascobolus immersus RN42]|uniref:glutathione synthase n=1 Tax=Ascobolus immersus RN42 TaxID=1160509 RepID=A0A3N4HAV4_ASCIM|nr:glutathione synthetase [Ascobolus immersus RN42]